VTIQVDTLPPDVPANLQSSARDRAVLLTWSPSSASDLLGYNIYRKGPQDSQFQKINGQVVTGTHYVDSDLTNGSLYQYKVSAVDDTMNEAHP
jgi:fibronectin type 3 domain-containing protein